MKFLIILALALASITGQAQTKNKDLQFNTASGVKVESNLIRNPVGRFGTDKYRTLSNMAAGNGSTIYDNFGSWALNATATSGYAEWELLTFSDEHKSGDCAYTASYNGTAANYKLQILDGSAVELNKIQLSDVTASTDVTLTYPCGASRKVRVTYTSTGTGATFDIGRLNYGKYIAQTVPDGASFFGGMEQVGAAGCTYTENTSSSATNFVDLGAGTGCSAWTVTGKVLATGTNDHRPILVTPGPGHYQVVINAGVYGKASGTCAWRLTDGTTTFPAQQQYSNSGQNLIPSLIFNITYSAQQASNMTLKVQAADDQATGCELNNGLTSAAMSWKIYKFPLNGTAYSNVVPASCINNPDCQNNFSAEVSSAGTVSKETSDFINGNCAVTDTSSFACTFVTSRFSAGPVCTVNPNTGTVSAIAQTDGSPSSTLLTVRTTNSPSTKAAYGFSITCSRQGTDVKPWGPIPLLSGMVSSNATTSERIERANVTCSGASTINNQSGSWITPGNISSGICAFTWPSTTWSSAPACTLTFSATAANAWALTKTVGATTTGFSSWGFNSSSGAALPSYTFDIICMGPR